MFVKLTDTRTHTQTCACCYTMVKEKHPVFILSLSETDQYSTLSILYKHIVSHFMNAEEGALHSFTHPLPSYSLENDQHNSIELKNKKRFDFHFENKDKFAIRSCLQWYKTRAMVKTKKIMEKWMRLLTSASFGQF